MINKQKLWFLTLFSIILVLSVYYVALDTDTLTNINPKEENSNVIKNIQEEDTLSSLRIEKEEEDIKTMSELNDILLDSSITIEDKNDAYEKIKSINTIKGKESYLESLILKEYNIKSFIKMKDDQINIVISSKEKNTQTANNIIRTIQKQFETQKYITVKYQ